jgi:hypothetical protein
MFLAIAPAAPRSGFTTSSSASPPWDFAGLVDPAAGLVSPPASAVGRALAEPLALPDVEAGGGFVADDDAAPVGALTFPALTFPALTFPALPFPADEGVPTLPLVDDRGAVVPAEEEPPELDPPDDDPVDDAPPDEELPDEEAPAVDVDDAAAPEAPVEDEELAPAVFSPSAGA